MKTVHKSVLIWYSSSEMFNLVIGVDHYPEFLPWCDHAAVLTREAHSMTAEVGLSIGGLRQVFTTRNDHVPDRSVHMQLVKGPFSRLDGQWLFTPVGAQAERACKVELTLQYGFDNTALSKLVSPVFDRIAASLVDAFVKRAEKIYG
jgi:ribosome-associated toxin RatA of RatAB toxin-antitoxin module